MPSIPQAFLSYVGARARGETMDRAALHLGTTAAARGSRWRVARSAEKWIPGVREAIEGAKQAAAAAVEHYLAQLAQRATP